ncbi:MAG TPA: hypothetical protein VF424_02565 [Vicinamibacterales bacterium]
MGEPIRLEREMSVSGQAGCATIIGIALLVTGIAVVAAMQSDTGAGQDNWVIYVVGVSFGAIGLLVAVLGLKMFLMARIPVTIVEVDRMPVRPGESFQMTVRQPGPIRLKSLRVNLVCEQTTTRPSAGLSKTSRDRRIIHQSNVLDLQEAAAGPGEEVVRHAGVSVPPDVRLADIAGRKEIVWRLEVWGRVRGWADFGHPFVIQVVDN